MQKTADSIGKDGDCMKFDGAIFDLDGTLLDSMYIWDSIGEDYLASLGIQPHENLNETFKTMSLRQAAGYYQSEYNVTLSLDEIMDGVNRMIEHYYMHDVKAKDGVKELLEKLKDNGVKMCVATATDLYLAEAAMRRNGILDYFSKIFTCTEVGFGKDSPQIYTQALAHLNTPKQSTVVFEDALYAITTAKEAGFCVVGVYDRSETKHRVKIEERSDMYIQSFKEMRDLID